jgi:arylsulfatase
MDLDVFSPRWDAQSDEERAFAARRMEIYAAMVSDLDTWVGKFVDHLETIGEYENTLILFLSDNGPEPTRRDLIPPISEHVGEEYDHSLDNLGRPSSYVMYGPNWATASAAPFRRHKFSGFEGGIHVPAFVRYPAIVEGGTRNDAFLTVMDVLPTFLELAGSTHPGNRYRGAPVHPPQGVSFLPLVAGHIDAVHPADQVDGWELWGHRSVQKGDWKIVWDAREGEDARWMLFNIAEDFGERSDLAESLPEKFEEMLAAWRQYEERNGVIYFPSR